MKDTPYTRRANHKFELPSVSSHAQIETKLSNNWCNDVFTHRTSLQYSQDFSFVTHSVGSTRMSSNSTPASANRIRMGSALPLTEKYVSLYLAIARSSGEVNDSQPLNEWTSRNLTPWLSVLRHFYSIRLCEKWHVHVKLESNIILQ